MKHTIVRWTVLALLGIVLAAGLTLATSRIVGQHIGLSSEPGTAGDRLAAPARTTTAPAPSDDDGGHGRGDD